MPYYDHNKDCLLYTSFPTPLASDNNTARDATSLDVFLSDNGIFRKLSLIHI